MSAILNKTRLCPLSRPAFDQLGRHSQPACRQDQPAQGGVRDLRRSDMICISATRQRQQPFSTASLTGQASRRDRNSVAVAGLLALLLTGCSLAPPYERPAAPVAATLPDSEGSALLPAGAERTDWKHFFADPALLQLLQQALSHNRDLLIATQHIEEARALYGIRSADQLPAISAGLTMLQLHLSSGLPMGNADFDSTQYAASLALSSWELDFWGRIRNLKAAALETYLSQVDARRAAELSLTAQVANTYLLERDLDERIDIARQTLASRETTWHIMQRRNEVGSISRLDVSQARSLYDQARAGLALLEQQKKRAHNALTLLAGMPLPEISVPLSAIENHFIAPTARDISSEVLLDRPDVQAAEHRLKAAHADIGVARAAFFPRITLFGTVGSSSSALDGLFSPDTRTWLFVPSLTQPLFDNGRNQAGLDLANARHNLAVADYERTIQTAFREVADALADRQWLNRQIDAQQAIVLDQTEQVRLARLRYEHGMSSFLDVLDAERSLFAARQTLVETRRALLSASVSLYAALGGGTSLAPANASPDAPAPRNKK